MASMLTLVALVVVCHALPSFLELQQATTAGPNMQFNEGFASSYLVALLSTIVVEARDKTFILTGLVAATKMRRAVGLGALTAMLFMTLVDALIGYIFVPLIKDGWVNWAAVIAYIAFFWLYLKDAWYFTEQPKNEELRESLLNGQSAGANSNPDQPPTQEQNHTPGAAPSAPLIPFEERSRRWLDLYVKSMALIFLGEWSDATMVSTSDLAQKNDFLGVVCGCMTAYCITTVVAVFAARWLGSKLQYRRLLILTSILFLLFAVFTVLY